MPGKKVVLLCSTSLFCACTVGKRVLQRLMTEFKELRNNFTRINPASSVIAESLPWANIVRFIVDIPLGTSGQGW